MRRKGVLVVVVGTLLMCAAQGEAQNPCASGPFVVPGSPLIGTAPAGSDRIILDASYVSTGSGCPPIIALTRITRRGLVKVRAKWDSCAGVPGPHRLRITLDPVTCDTMDAKFRSKGVRPARKFIANRETVACGYDDRDTFEIIQERIFAQHGCNVSTCHGPFGQGNLDLRDGASYAELVNAPADNATAASLGKKRVTPFAAASSFLSQKLRGTLVAGEGSQMPLVGNPLSAIELSLVDAWINAGAAETGVVAGAPCLPPLEYVQPDPPPVPPGGYQVVLDGPVLQPGEEQEGCFWVANPNTSNFNVSKWEFVLNPGTHHFAVYENRASVPNPPTGQWLLNDYGCFMEAEYGASLSGAPQAPYYIDNYPAGMTKTLQAGKYLGLNAHYHNDFDVPIQMKVWVNIYPFAGTPQHYLQTLTSLDTTFGISVPPFTQKVQHGQFVNATALPMSFVNLSGHMHKRGLRFTAWRSNGTLLYENFDWAHPVGIQFQPPVVLNPGDWIDYECLHDNGVTRPVKLDAFGNPTTLTFGVTTDDEMCILPGSYYSD